MPKSPVKIEAFPVPTCCGAAVLTGFGMDGWSKRAFILQYGEDAWNRIITDFHQACDDFEKVDGMFKPYGRLRRDKYATEDEDNRLKHEVPSAYFSSRRSHLTAYLNDQQVIEWREIIEARGFKEVDSFHNYKSGRTVYVFSKTAGN